MISRRQTDEVIAFKFHTHKETSRSMRATQLLRPNNRKPIKSRLLELGGDKAAKIQKTNGRSPRGDPCYRMRLCELIAFVKSPTPTPPPQKQQQQ